MNLYSVVMPSTSITAAKDLIRVSAPADAALFVHRAEISQQGSEVSDQVSGIIRRATADGTGSANTPAPIGDGPAFPGTAIHNLTVDATAGAKLVEEGFNLLNGWLWIPAPAERIKVPKAGRIVLRLATAPAAATNVIARLVVEVQY